MLKLDIGCGTNKKDGCIGIDYLQLDGVDHVVDLTKDMLPFPDQSVDYIYSAHFMEHVKIPNNVFKEIGRVSKDGATIEVWHPYGFHNDAFLYGHEMFLTEEHWLHICVKFPDHYYNISQSRWLLNKIVYRVEYPVYQEITAQGISIAFAIKYLKNIVKEIGVFMTVTHTRDAKTVMPEEFYTYGRESDYIPLYSPNQVHDGVEE